MRPKCGIFSGHSNRAAEYDQNKQIQISLTALLALHKYLGGQ